MAPPPYSAPSIHGTFEAALGIPAEAAEFAVRQARTANSEPMLADHQAAAAAWLGQFTEGQDPAELVDAAIARAETSPDRTTLLETQAILCELGRDPAMTVLITSRLTRDLLHRVAEASRPKGG